MVTASCAQQYAARPEGIDLYQAARVWVITGVSGAEEEAKKLSEFIVDALRNLDLYQDVDVGQREEPLVKTLLVKVEIVNVNRTSDTERVAFGKMARSNEVAAAVSLIDGATTEVLTSFRLRGVSPERTGLRIDWPWGSVDKALQQISQHLARQLADWSRIPK